MRDARLRFGHLGYFALAAVLLADAFPARAKDATCSLGRFTVQGRALFAGVPDPAGADVAGAASVIVLAGGQVAIAGSCAPTALRLVQTGRGARVKAAWEACTGVVGPVRLSGMIGPHGCQRLVGRIRAKQARLSRRFRALLSKGDPGSCITDSTFDQIQHRILGPRGCRVAACHGAGQAGGLDLRYGTASLALIDAPAANPAAAAAGKRRVVAGDPDASFLWQKVSGHLQPAEGTRMPQVGRPLDALELELIRAWIAGGAPLTGQVAGAPCLAKDEFQPAPALPVPPGGYQIVLDGPTLQPGAEIEGCMWVRVPNTEDFAVGKWEFSLNPGTHHFAMWDHMRGDDPPLGVFQRDTACIGGGARLDGVSVSGSPEAPYFVDAYPAGVGRVVKGGQLLGLNPHYHNDFDVPIQMKVWINLHPVTGPLQHVAESLVSTFAALDGRNAFSIFVPPYETATLRVRYANTTDRPWQIFQLSSHEHQRGTRFTAWRADGTTLFENLDWAHPAILTYDPPLVVQPGDYIEYECEHDNGVIRPLRRCGDSPLDAGCTPGTPVPVTFGVTSVDEMCLVTGQYYKE